MYRIDHQLSTAQNVVNLLNDKALHQMQANDFTLDALQPITPNAGNGMNNTQATLTGTPTGRLDGQSNVTYTRFGVAQSRPTAGTHILVASGDTHASVHAKICERHGLVAEEVTFIDPIRVPVGGEAMNYTVSAKANSPIYTPGSMVISARNNTPFTSAHPNYFYGSPVGTYLDKPVYLLPSTVLDLYSNHKINKRVALFNLMNAKRLKLDREMLPADLALGVPIAQGVSGQSGNTLVEFTPIGSNPALTEGGYFLYGRQALPDTITIPTTHADAAYYAGLSNELLYSGMVTKRFMPRDEYQFVRVVEIEGSRTVEYRQIVPSYIFVTNTNDMSFTIASE